MGTLEQAKETWRNFWAGSFKKSTIKHRNYGGKKMPLEYAVYEIPRRMKADELEDKLNALAKKGWRVKCSVSTNRLILVRDILFPGLKDSL